MRQGKDATERISKICHDYSEEFLESVGRVVTALGGPCEEVRSSLEEVRMKIGVCIMNIVLFNSTILHYLSLLSYA